MALSPLVSKLFENGLNLLGNAVMAKGQDVLEKELGVKIEEPVTPEQVARMRELEITHEEFLINAAIKQRELELEDKKADNVNTDSARTMNLGIQESKQASVLAKNMAYYIDAGIITATLFFIGLILFKAVPPENKEIFFTAFGSLLAMCNTILNFHRGTSSSSKAKDEQNKSLTELLKDK